jgi:hypothetical protein
MPDDIASKIEESAQGPQRVRTDAGEVQAHPLPDLIEADKYVASRDAVSASPNRTHRGLRFNTLKPPGSV